MDNILLEIVRTSQRLSASSKYSYEKTVREFLEFAGADPYNWTPRTAQSFYLHLLNRMKITSANTMFARLAYASRRYAQVEQQPSLDFAAVVEKQSATDAEVRHALDQISLKKILAACDGTDPRDKRDKAILSLLIFTGMRRSSLCGIHFEHFSRGSVNIRLKGGKRHDVPLTEELKCSLRPWLKYLKKIEIQDGPVFRSFKGNSVLSGLSGRGVYNIIKARAEAAGIRGVHPHIFRHSFITLCKVAGMSDMQIAAITGHVTRGDVSKTINATYTDNSVAGTAAQVALQDLIEIA